MRAKAARLFAVSAQRTSVCITSTMATANATRWRFPSGRGSAESWTGGTRRMVPGAQARARTAGSARRPAVAQPLRSIVRDALSEAHHEREDLEAEDCSRGGKTAGERDAAAQSRGDDEPEECCPSDHERHCSLDW